MIFYFTGTGNSRWVAEALGTAFDEPLVSIADALNEGKDENVYPLREREKVFFINSGKLLFVPYTKDFGRITQFWGNDLATVLYATFCSDMLSSHSFSKQR